MLHILNGFKSASCMKKTEKTRLMAMTENSQVVNTDAVWFNEGDLIIIPVINIQSQTLLAFIVGVRAPWLFVHAEAATRLFVRDHLNNLLPFFLEVFIFTCQ